MNVSVYLFGEFNGGYTQYPDDYSVSIFQQFSKKSKSTTQLTIHRDGNLMYYGYLRKLQQDKYIGLCVVLNALCLRQIDSLFSLFETTISNLVAKGALIQFDEAGEIVTSVEKLYLNREEIDLITESLRAGFNALEPHCTILPAVSYGTSKDSSKDFTIDDNIDDIIKSSYTNGYTYIYKSKGYNTALLNSYRGILKRTNKEKQELQEKLDSLQKEYSKLLKKKKQFTVITILFIVLLGCAVGLLSLNDNLNVTRNELIAANNKIIIQNDSLNCKSLKITNLQEDNERLKKSLRVEKNDRIRIETVFTNFKSMVENRQPFIVKSTSFNFSQGYLDISYYGMTNKTIKLNVRAYNDEGEHYYYNSTVDIYEGDNTIRLYVSNNLNRDKWYSFEILVDKVIIGGDRH